ncbi:MAG: PorP/SprF family type IX secretion system membrane protein [Bacteroidia bacterium]|nr:PorP/SprF family type IX secretion system membrane protein [Bacteroidia bacterium]
MFFSAHSSLRSFSSVHNQSLPTIGTIDYAQQNRSTTRRWVVGRPEHGLGTLFMYDQTGAVSRMMAYLSYAVHIPMTRTLRVSFGVHGGFLRYRQNNDALFPLDPNDPVLGTGIASTFIPDVAAGIMIRHPNFYWGFAVNQLLENNFGIADAELGNPNELLRHYYVHGGYRFALDARERIHLTPSTMIRFLPGAPVSADVNALLDFGLGTRYFRVGLGYRYDNALSGLVGFSINRLLDLTYSYDYTTTRLNELNSGTHEISLGLKVGKLTDDRPRLY